MGGGGGGCIMEGVCRADQDWAGGEVIRKIGKR